MARFVYIVYILTVDKRLLLKKQMLLTLYYQNWDLWTENILYQITCSLPSKIISSLIYVLNSCIPATYRSRNRRQLSYSEPAEPFDADEVEKYIVGEFGAKACVFERVCARYATRARALPRPQLDWPDVFR